MEKNSIFNMLSTTTSKIIAGVIAAVAVVIVVLVSIFAGKGNHPETNTRAKEQTASDALTAEETTKQLKENASSGEEETDNAAEEVTKEEKAEIETNVDGAVSSVTTQDGIKIDLSGETETEAGSDGSITYKMSDGSRVVVSSDGNAKVITTEKTAKAETAENELTGNTSSKKNEQTDSGNVNGSTEKTMAGAQEQTSTEKTAQNPVQPSTQAPTVRPTEAPTQAPAQPPVIQAPTVCYHENYTKRVTTVATSSANGAWEEVCTDCGQVLETGVIHAYSAYTVDLGNGNTTTVYGYYDDAVADEIYQQLNTYRQQNGLNTLDRVFDEQSRIRAVECAYSFSHTRPNGTEPGDMHSYLFGENCAGRGTGNDTAQGFMDGWKNSLGHNSNMLDSDCTMCGISVFHRVDFDEYGIPFSNTAFGVQNFGFAW